MTVLSISFEFDTISSGHLPASSSVSIANVEQVNAHWISICFFLITPVSAYIDITVIFFLDDAALKPLKIHIWNLIGLFKDLKKFCGILKLYNIIETFKLRCIFQYTLELKLHSQSLKNF